jgi:hypothetical protein
MLATRFSVERTPQLRRKIVKPYVVQYRQSAYTERLKLCDVYGLRACDRLRSWLDALAAEAAARQGKLSTEVNPEEWLRSIESLKTNWEKWWGAGPREKVNAILHVIKTRTPPWEFRHAQYELRLLDSVTDDIEAWYEVDHASKRLVVTKLDLPPRD